jgi:pyridoxal phosphate enzyme (YggS family)
VTVPSLEENLSSLRARIAAAAARAGRDPASVRLLAVSKGQPVERLLEASRAGVRLFGENYLQEAEAKVPLLPAGTEWHFIGRLQGNKVKRAVALFTCIGAVHTAALLRDVGRRASEAGKVVDALVEVNLAGEGSKGGVSPGELLPLLAEGGEIPSVRVRGLMAIPPVPGDPEESRPWFRSLRALLELCRAAGHVGMTELSMGMSADFEAAVEEGATIVRLGTVLFGGRGGSVP